jgi:hypothetical protein
MMEAAKSSETIVADHIIIRRHNLEFEYSSPWKPQISLSWFILKYYPEIFLGGIFFGIIYQDCRNPDWESNPGSPEYVAGSCPLCMYNFFLIDSETERCF